MSPFDAILPPPGHRLIAGTVAQGSAYFLVLIPTTKAGDLIVCILKVRADGKRELQLVEEPVPRDEVGSLVDTISDVTWNDADRHVMPHAPVDFEAWSKSVEEGTPVRREAAPIPGAATFH